MKYIRTTMPDGSKWDVPALFVAEHRARYYAKHDTKQDGGAEFDRVFAEEVEFALTDTDALFDWAQNNLNWRDVSAMAEKVKESDPPDMEEGWTNGEKELVES